MPTLFALLPQTNGVLCHIRELDELNLAEECLQSPLLVRRIPLPGYIRIEPLESSVGALLEK